MIQAVESDNTPLRLMLGADAYGLWNKNAPSNAPNLRNGVKSELILHLTELKLHQSAADLINNQELLLVFMQKLSKLLYYARWFGGA